MPAGPSSDLDNVSLAELTQEIAQLRDLFQRRLFEDKAKNRLYEELHEQLALARGGLREQLLAPLFCEILLVVDRVRRFNPNGDEVLDSIVDELEEILSRYGVRRVPKAELFDPAYHDAIRAESADGRPPGTILEVVRPGYLIGGQLLRAEQVVLTAEPAASCPPSG
jgi:molecular chaperone GrpE